MVEHNIHSALLEVYKQVGYVQKKGKITQGMKYNYAKESDFIEAIRPAMVEMGIVVHSSGISDIERTENSKVTKYTDDRNGAVSERDQTVYHFSAIYHFTFVHTPSNTSITTAAAGEGIDRNGDKAAYKASTGAMKYALRQTFLIETGDDPDDTPSGDMAKSAPARTAPAKVSAPARQPLISIPGIESCETQAELISLWKGNSKVLKELQVNNPDVYQNLEAAKDKRKTELGAQS